MPSITSSRTNTVSRFVPLPCCVVLGMDQQAADTRNVGGLCGAQQCILEQGLAQTFTLMLLVHSEPGQDQDRHRVARQQTEG